jgi:hypothetical protein
MFFQFKNKGALVIIHAIVPIATLMILTATLNKYACDGHMPKPVYGIVFGIAFIISGFWTNYSSNDYYLDDDGEKQYMYFDNQFMFLDMKIWPYIFWIIGGFGLVGSVFELVEYIAKHL